MWDSIGIIGAGGWGTALSIVMSAKVSRVDLWARRLEIVREIEVRRTNETYLPGAVVPENVVPTSDIEGVIQGNAVLILAVPSQYVRSVARIMAGHLNEGSAVVHAAKGIEENTLLRMSQVLEQELDVTGSDGVANSILVLSGPSHAEEVARGIPTTVVLASRNIPLAEEIQLFLMTPRFRVYTNSDVVGVELAGAFKNVIALATGVSDGLGFGDNTRAALITRGLAEIARLGVKMGAEPSTFAGLSGMGDLVVTCTSKYSRNRRAGALIGQGRTLEEVVSGTRMVVEGVGTTRAVCRLASIHDVEMPIARKLHAVLFEGLEPMEAVKDLMMRDATREGGD